jgi:hypothetical protein
LWYLVNYFCSHYVTHDTSCQTEAYGHLKSVSALGKLIKKTNNTNIFYYNPIKDFKLKHLEKQYSDKYDKLSIHGTMSIEEKILSHQKRIEEKAKVELEEKLNEFKESEFNKYKLEQNEKIRIELEKTKKEYENAYQNRFNSLLAKEKNIEELVKQKHDIDQRELFSQRQQLLEELKLLKDREMDFKRHSESQTRSFETDLAKFKKFEDEFKKREFQLKLAENDFDQRLRTEKEKIRFEVERSFAQREFLLQSIENKNKEDTKRIDIEKSQIDRVKKELQTLQIRSSELELELQKSRAQALSFLNENNLLKDKLSQCLNYDVIKEENNYLKAQLETIKIHLGENYMQKQNQIKNVSKITTKSAFKPIQRKRSVTFANENNNNNTGESITLPDSILATGLTSKDDEAFELGDRLLTVADNQLFLEQKIEDQNLNNNKLQDLYEMQIYESRQVLNEVSDLKTQIKFLNHGIPLPHDAEFEANFPLNTKFSTDDSSKTFKHPSASIESVAFIESTKERLKHLDNEAEKIEKNYRDYQYRLTTTTYPVDDEYSLNTKNKINDESFNLSEFLAPILSTNSKNSGGPNENHQNLNNRNYEVVKQISMDLNDYKDFAKKSSLVNRELFKHDTKFDITKPAEQTILRQESVNNKSSTSSENILSNKKTELNNLNSKPTLTREKTMYVESSDESSKNDKKQVFNKQNNNQRVAEIKKYADSSSETESEKPRNSFDAHFDAYMAKLSEPEKPTVTIESKPLNRTEIVFEQDDNSEESIKNVKIERESSTSDDDFNF